MPVPDSLRAYEKDFSAKYASFQFVDARFEKSASIPNCFVVTLECVWRQYSIPRAFTLVYHVKKDMPGFPWRGEFNPFASRPMYPNACDIDWIYTYYISKFPVLNALEKVLASEVEAVISKDHEPIL
jgi:hypothetical protein